MDRVLVTGGAGFIGSNFIRYLAETHPETEIVNLDKLTYAGNLENLRDLKGNKNYSFIKGDICDKKVVAKAMKGCDVVVNFAAESHVDRSIEEPASFIKTDVFGAYVLLEEARKQDVEKVIQISTDEVYGSIQKGSFTEESVLNPTNPYSASKAGADRLAFSYFATYGLPVIITRSSNNYGPYQFPEKVIPLFITNLIQGKKVPLYGDGLNVRDWLYVKDNCEAIDLALRKGKNGEVYNIGGGSEKTNLELTRFILREIGKGEEMIEHVKDRLGHDRRYSLSFEKIAFLGYKPKKTFENRMRETIQWYKKNKKWWIPLLKKAAFERKSVS
ncbi:MAG TPA: dTDP-glucose 4,6-dehydratase [Candidatus Diapherotrites archaeon]|uniref:dTDP-glucose 4,6-dehydratase n=1 Tax=Candidatus Iainarchaeum sp. TaxID=3101447 RepID=A0A7J4J008_9ARCH|nr:dTDP-glucose 4,6-dehydratase [Candidatus Diapherotrites archaeon]